MSTLVFVALNVGVWAYFAMEPDRDAFLLDVGFTCGSAAALALRAFSVWVAQPLEEDA